MPQPISRAIIDKRVPVGVGVGKKLLTKAVEPGGGEVALASQLVHVHNSLFEHADRALHLPMPELPLQRLDVLVNVRGSPRRRQRGDEMIGNLLPGPNLHRQVKPANICVVGAGRAFGNRFIISAPSERIVISLCPQYPSNWRACSVLTPYLKLRSVARCEIMTRLHPSPAASTRQIHRKLTGS